MLTFEPIAHVYKWHGVIVPGVTGVMEDVGVINFENMPAFAREMGLERGSLVHEAVAIDTRWPGDLDEGPESINSDHLGFIHAARQFRIDKQVEIDNEHDVEMRVYNPTFLFAGTIDLRCTLDLPVGRARAIVDYKCSHAPEWCKYQTAAYLSTQEDPRAWWRCAVELHKDGTYKMDKIYAGRDYQSHLNGFLAFLYTFNAKRACNPAIYRKRTAS